ncbi:DUF6922 domain-containing protein [Ornithobacterium rhinotracheale]|uniref:DUF6922 domain-containing protein n=1 Tax=Ornithobacterium rhinotracheale TaxID=28251 RepID=UPI0040352299
MIFDDWKKHTESIIRPSLLWEYNLENFNWHKNRGIVVQRVIERGRYSDWYAVINLYGGLDNLIEIIKNDVPVLNEARDLNFVCVRFNLKKEDLKCYRRKQRREQLLNS